MIHLRATRKVLRYLGPPSAAVGPPDALLGDWFVNRFVLERRSLLGTMNEFVLSSRHYAPPEGGWNREALSSLESRLERMPCRVTRPQSETVFPADLTRELLTRRVN